MGSSVDLEVDASHSLRPSPDSSARRSYPVMLMPAPDCRPQRCRQPVDALCTALHSQFILQFFSFLMSKITLCISDPSEYNGRNGDPRAAHTKPEG